MDIVSQSGEFYYQGSGVWWEAFVDVLMPLATLVFGFMMPIVYQKIQDRRKLKDLKNQIVHEVTMMRKSIIRQISVFEDFSESLEKENPRVWLNFELVTNLVGLNNKFSKYSPSDIAKLSRLDNEDGKFTDTYKLYHNLVEAIVLVDKTISVAEILGKERLGHINSYRDQAQIGISNIQKKLQEYKLAGETNQTAQQSIELLIRFLKDQDETAMFFGKRNFVDPLTELVRPRALNDGVALELVRMLDDCHRAYKGMEGDLKYIRNSFNGLTNSLESAVSMIDPFLDRAIKD